MLFDPRSGYVTKGRTTTRFTLLGLQKLSDSNSKYLCPQKVVAVLKGYHSVRKYSIRLENHLKVQTYSINPNGVAYDNNGVNVCEVHMYSFLLASCLDRR